MYAFYRTTSIVFLFVIVGLILLSFSLYYRIREQKNTSGIFRRAFFFRERPYSLDTGSIWLHEVDPSRARKHLASELSWHSSAFRDAMLELFSYGHFPPAVFVYGHAGDYFEPDISQYPLKSFDASGVKTNRADFCVSSNPMLEKLILPPAEDLYLDFMDCPNLKTVRFTGPPPACLNSDAREIASCVSPDFHFEIPPAYLEAYQSSAWGSLAFHPGLERARPVPIQPFVSSVPSAEHFLR